MKLKSGIIVSAFDSFAFDNVKGAHPDRAKGTHPFVNGLRLIAVAALVVTVVNPAGFSKQRRKSSRRYCRRRPYSISSAAAVSTSVPLPQFFLFGSFSFFFQMRLPRGEIIRATIVYRRRSRSCPTLSMPGILVHMAPPASASGRCPGFFLSLVFLRLSVNRMLSQSNSWIEQ